MIKVTSKITLEINGKKITMSLEDARRLRDELDNILGTVAPPFPWSIPSIPPEPITPPVPFTPQYPYYTTTPNTGDPLPPLPVVICDDMTEYNWS